MSFDVTNIGKDKINSSRYSFTSDQEVAISGIIDFIAQKFDPANYIIGLVGAGGTGKTFVTNYIITHCKYSNSVIKCTSTTHKACRVFSEAIYGKNVDTIQSTFGLRLDLKLEDFDPQRPQFNPNASPKLDNIKLLIVDEASMLPAKLTTYICNTCKKLNIKIIYIGDDHQLAPVNQKISTAFKLCSVVYTLKEVVRQSEQNPIKELLDILRDDIKNKTYKFLEFVSKNIGSISYNEIGEGYSICNYPKFKEHIDVLFRNEEYTKNIDLYRIICYTNTNVTAWNTYIRNNIITGAEKAIINKNDLIMSYQTIVNDFLETVISNSEEYIIDDIVDYVDNDYQFKGFLVKFQQIHGGNKTKPLFIVDHTDKFTIQMYYKVLNDLVKDAKNATGGTRASLWKKYYDFKKKYLIITNITDRTGKIIFQRDIDYGFAITAHKSQGSTYNTVFVDLNDMVFDKNGRIYNNQDDLLRRLYVACSRAKHELIIGYGN